MICAKASDWRIDDKARRCDSVLRAEPSAAGGLRTSGSGRPGAAASAAADGSPALPSAPALDASVAPSGSALVLERNSIPSLLFDKSQIGLAFEFLDVQQPR